MIFCMYVRNNLKKGNCIILYCMSFRILENNKDTIQNSALLDVREGNPSVSDGFLYIACAEHGTQSRNDLTNEQEGKGKGICKCLDPGASFTKHRLTLTPAWISNYVTSKVRANSTYLLIPKLQRLHRWSMGMDNQYQPTIYYGYNYFTTLGFKLIYIDKRGPVRYLQNVQVSIFLINSVLCRSMKCHIIICEWRGLRLFQYKRHHNLCDSANAGLILVLHPNNEVQSNAVSHWLSANIESSLWFLLDGVVFDPE